MLSYKQKLIEFNKIRQELKNKTIELDENKKYFGHVKTTPLKKKDKEEDDEIKGFPYKLRLKGNHQIKNISIKIIPIETKYTTQEHPCFIENIILKELTDNIINKNISPHIVFYFGSNKVVNKSNALFDMNLKNFYNNKKIKSYSNMLVSEFVEGLSLEEWVYRQTKKDIDISSTTWLSMIFQLLYTIYIFQHKYKLLHNDFHYGNILIDDTIKKEGYFIYKMFNKTYYIKNNGIMPKLWDFEFCMTFSDSIKSLYPNKYIIGMSKYDKKTYKTSLNTEDQSFHVPLNYNEVYDSHYLLTSLLELYLPEDIYEWILNLYPAQVIEDDSTSDLSDESDSSYSQYDSDSIKSADKMFSRLNNDNFTTDSRKSSHNTKSSYETDESDEVYIENGRLLNKTLKEFTLPTTKEILFDKIFDKFLKKPHDLNPAIDVVFDSHIH
jgi:hypothetical protein